MNTTRSIIAGFAVASCFGLAACGGGKPVVTAPPPPPPIHLSVQGEADYLGAGCIYLEVERGTDPGYAANGCVQALATQVGSVALPGAEQAVSTELNCIYSKGISACTPTKRQFEDR